MNMDTLGARTWCSINADYFIYVTQRYTIQILYTVASPKSTWSEKLIRCDTGDVICLSLSPDKTMFKEVEKNA